MKRIPYPSIDKDKGDLYGEELNYYIDTISNLKESITNSDKSSEIVNNINNYQYIPRSIDSHQKTKKSPQTYKNMNSKDKYIRSLERKVIQQKEQILKLMDYKNLCEEKIKEMNPLISLPLQKDNIFINYNNDIFKSKIDSNNKNQPNKKKLNLSYNQNNINSKQKHGKGNKSFKINRANSEFDINSISNSDEDKYDKLYAKYIKIINDFKNLSNNSVSTNEYTRLKTQFNELKNKNNNLLRQIQNKTNNDMEEKELINKLKEQVKTFREELVLSQAMVNSLRSEIEQYNKNNKKSSMTNNNIESSDRNNIQDNNYNYMNNNLLKEENDNLKQSLKNNNILLSKVLEENNKLRNGSNNRDNENENISNIKNNLIQYENKFEYFNDYINNIKNKIDMIFNYIKNILCKFESPENNKRFSENLKMKIDNLKKDIQKIKGIDRFNLDSQDDEQTLQIFMNIVKLLLNELEQNKPNINTNNINPQNKTFDKTKKYLFDILNILKETVNENGKKQLISDALNILSNLNELYRLKNNNNISNGYNNINEKIMEQEKELDYIKKLLLNHRKENRNKKLTYSMNYSSPKIGIQKNKSGYYFQYE